MAKLFWSTLTVTPALLSVVVLAAASAFASTSTDAASQEATQPISVAESGLVSDRSQSSTAELTQVSVTASSTSQSGLASGSAKSELTPEEVGSNGQSVIQNSTAETALENNTPVQTLAQAPSSSTQANTTGLENSVLDQVAQYDQLEQVTPSNSSDALQSGNPLLNQVSSYGNQDGSSDPLAQVTSITQLSDVQPTGWAYQALQSLVERYGCIVGYPDSTFRGQRALSRFEFAAGLNACLDRISELLAASTADLATKEDLATLQRLQEEFAAELASLRGRVDVLDSRVTELEANQFSTTTKLSGDAYFTVSDLFGDEDTTDQNNAVFQYRSRLTFTTSFSGRDQLNAILQEGNVQRFIQPGNDVRLAGEANTGGTTVVDTLSYVFPVGDVASVAIFANAASLDTLVFGAITPFDIGAARGAVTRFSQRPPIYRTASVSSGVGVNFLLTDKLSAQIGFASGEAGNPSPGSGLFNGNYGILGQLKARNLFNILDLSLTYINSYTGISTSSSGAIIAGVQTGTGSLLAAVDADRPVVANSYGVAANLKFDGFQIGGWAGFSAIRALELGDADVWNYALTLAFPDLAGKGNLGGLVVGVQPRLTGATPALGEVLGRRSDPSTGISVEAFYRITLNDNIDITPAVSWITAPNHDADNGDLIFGAVRTTFRF